MDTIPQSWTIFCLGIFLVPVGCNADAVEGNSSSSDAAVNNTVDAALDSDASSIQQRCDDPVSLLQSEPSDTSFSSVPTTVPSGLQRCADESYHRVAVETCLPGWQERNGCSCEPGSFDGGIGCNEDGFCYEVAGCATNDDCNAGQACLCSAGIDPAGGGYLSFNDNKCVRAECETDADCDGYECGVSNWGCDVNGIFCHTAQDECHGNADCSDGPCSFEGDRWKCTGSVTCD